METTYEKISNKKARKVLVKTETVEIDLDAILKAKEELQARIDALLQEMTKVDNEIKELKKIGID